MTFPPNPSAAPADQALADVALTSGEYLAGVIELGMLEVVGRPEKLTSLVPPDIDQKTFERVSAIVMPIGYRAGLIAANPRWVPGALRRLKQALADVGYTAMSRVVGAAANIHPADDETEREHP